MRGNDHMWLTSLLMALSSADEFISESEYLWFPLFIIVSRLDFLVFSYIGDKW